MNEVRRLPPGKRSKNDAEGLYADLGGDGSDEVEDGHAEEKSEARPGEVAQRRARFSCIEGNGRGSIAGAARGNSIGTEAEEGEASPPTDEAAPGAAVLHGFRRLLWFWSEYYLRGGRDRLSLEFSTHVKFWAWKRVIRLLCADDGSPTALVPAPLRLPRSPYESSSPVSQLCYRPQRLE